MVQVSVDAIRLPDRSSARRVAHSRLEHIRLEQGHRATEIAVDACKRLLAAPVEFWRTNDRKTDDALRLDVAAHILVELADAELCPARCLSALVEEEQVPFQTIQSRREGTKSQLVAAPETKRLAAQLLADPSGTSVTTPRMPRLKMSQAAILVVALTEG